MIEHKTVLTMFPFFQTLIIAQMFEVKEVTAIHKHLYYRRYNNETIH